MHLPPRAVAVRPLSAAVAVAAVLALAAAPARADLIRLFDGRTIEGTVTRSANSVKVKGFKGKSSTYAASEVKFVESAECTWEVAAKMVRAIPPDASDALFVEKHMEVARYVKERVQYSPEVAELERKEYDLVLRKSPDLEEARVGMGHVKWGKWWFKNEKDRDNFRKTAQPEVMEPLGYQKYRKTNMWETKEDVAAIEAGKVKFRGKWMTEDEKKEAEGYIRDEKGTWLLARDVNDRKRSEEVEKLLGEKPGTVTSSEHFRFISWFPVGESARLKDLAGKTYSWARDFMGYPLAAEAEGGEALFGVPIEVFALVDKKRKDKWLDTFGPGYGYDPSSIEFHRKGNGWHRLSPGPYFITSGSPPEKNRQRDLEQDFEQASIHITSMAGRIVLDRIRQGNTQPWLSEGMGLVTEVRFHETAQCCYVTETKYQEEVASKDGSKAKYYDFMKKQVAAGLDRSMRQIFSLDLNYLDWADSVKSWSFLEFLGAKYLPEFQKLMRRPMPDVEEITPAQIQAAIQARKPKDPAAGGPKAKDEGVVPTENQKVSGPGAIQVTEDSKEQRAVQAARAEAWITSVIAKDFDAIEAEWKAWLVAHP